MGDLALNPLRSPHQVLLPQLVWAGTVPPLPAAERPSQPRPGLPRHRLPFCPGEPCQAGISVPKTWGHRSGPVWLLRCVVHLNLSATMLFTALGHATLLLLLQHPLAPGHDACGMWVLPPTLAGAARGHPMPGMGHPRLLRWGGHCVPWVVHAPGMEPAPLPPRQQQETSAWGRMWLTQAPGHGAGATPPPHSVMGGQQGPP